MRKRYEFVTGEGDTENVMSSDHSKRLRNSIYSVPLYAVFGLIFLLLGLCGLVYLIDNQLPTPLKLEDEVKYPDAFITDRARHDLKLLTGLGPRVAGSYENEVLTVEFLKREINFVMQQAHKNQKIELDVQVVTGSYYLNTTPVGKVVAYSNLQNVVVKLHSNNSQDSLLVNAHFDSVPTSPGGSDDGINCAVMLEILRKLSRQPERPLHNIIFLFNGAEETGLQASHGFITKHKWAKECRVFINLESAGHEGKIALFQTGPSAPWLLKYYCQVPHPYGQAAGEEIFQSGIIPSDTDFRIFRDFGGLIGLDMAFVKDGYRYHTKYDDFDHIPPGSIQHAGDNSLALIKHISNAPELSNPKNNPGKVVYFDVLGLFMVSYTSTVTNILNYITVFLSFAIFIFSMSVFNLGFNKQELKYVLITLGAIIGGWLLAGLTIILIAICIDALGYSMSWYSNPWLIFGLFVIPTLISSSILLPLIQHDNLSDNVKAHVQAHIVRLTWSALLFVGTVLQIRAMYALLIPVIFNTFGFIIIYGFKLQHTVRKWQIIYILSLVVPSVYLLYCARTTFMLFVPTTGRIGSDKNADLIIGLISWFFTILITSAFVALVNLIRNFKYFLIILSTVFLINLVIVFTPAGFPYNGDVDSATPQRYWILHTRRVFHNENGDETKRDSGYFMLNMDRNSPSIIKKHVTDLNRAKSLEQDCNNYLLCGLPLAHSKMIQIIKHSTWIPAGQPMFSQATKFEVLSKTNLSPTTLRYNVSVLGPDRIGLYLSPKQGVKVLKISLINEMPPEENTEVWNRRPLYFLLHTCGKEIAPLQFTFDVEVPVNYTEGVTTEIAVTGVYVHDNDNRKMPHYVQFLNQFPKWADLTAWLGSYESWWI